MCGIVGYWLKKEKVNSVNLKNSMKKMHHRGPDGEGLWISPQKNIGFGHVRLSIVDLGSRANQPMEMEDYVIVFNGEIYNYRELRKDLEKKYKIKFKTTSDTEVLLHMYKIYKEKCLNYIEGMFAFSIYGKKEKRIFIANDFIGQKPLIYTQNKKGFFFASEIEALFPLSKSIIRKIDTDALQIYLIDTMYHIPPPWTIYQNIRKLEPSTYMIIEKGTLIKKKKYTTLRRIKQKTKTDSYLLSKLNQMEPQDVGYAAFLSGGIDSSFICYGMQQRNRIDAYTLKTSNSDEDFIRSQYVAKKLNIKHNTIEFKDIDMLKSINTIVKIKGEPYYHRTSIYADAILNKVKKNHKVMFSGAGGDELYFGYDNRTFLLIDFFYKIKRIIPRFLINTIGARLKGYKRVAWFSDAKSLKTKILRYALTEGQSVINSKVLSKMTPIKKIDTIVKDFEKQCSPANYLEYSYLFGLFVENAHSLVIQADVVGMKNSIEIRSLFLEKEVIEDAYAMGLSKKLMVTKLKEGKKNLRKYLRKCFDRKFLYSRKIGFGVESPVEDKVRKKYLKQISNKLSKLGERDIFNKDAIENLLSDMHKNYEKIMKLYALEGWLEMYENEKGRY